MRKPLILAFVLTVIIALGASLLYKTTNTIIPVEPEATFGGVSLTLDYALTDMERQRGLGGRASVPEDYGMLFVFPNDGKYGFWMKDTLIPLDIFWLNAQGQVVSRVENVATSTYPDVFYPAAPARYVLELTAGFARTHGVATGTPLRLKNFPTVTK